MQPLVPDDRAATSSVFWLVAVRWIPLWRHIGDKSIVGNLEQGSMPSGVFEVEIGDRVTCRPYFVRVNGWPCWHPFTSTKPHLRPGILAGVLPASGCKFCTCELLARAWSSQVQKQSRAARKVPASGGGARWKLVLVNRARVPRRPRDLCAINAERCRVLSCWPRNHMKGRGYLP
jgi:hypothetical protein